MTNPSGADEPPAPVPPPAYEPAQPPAVPAQVQPPTSAIPVSTPGYPVAYPPGYPVPYGAPYGAMPPPPIAPSPSGGKVAIIVLAAVLGLFVLISGGLAALYVQQAGHTGDQIDTLRAEKAELQRRLDLAERDLTDAEDDLDAMTDERDKMAGCLEAFFVWLSTEVGSAEETTALTEAQDRCAEAGY